MKLLPIALLLLAWGTISAAAQSLTPAVPMKPAYIGQGPGWLYVAGIWGTDKHLESSQELSESTIYCDQKTKTCEEANSHVFVASWQGGALLDNAIYPISYNVERWSKTEMVASTLEGDCRVRYVLKFDLVQQRVFWSSSLSEPMPTPMSDGFSCNSEKPRQLELYERTGLILKMK
jgi:hypothetical protein